MGHKDKLPEDEAKARRLAAAKRYRDANKEKCVAASLASRAKKPEEYSAKQAELRERNADHIKAQQLEYRAANRERINAQTVAWQKANPEKHKAYLRKYELLNRAAAITRKKKWRQDNAEYAAAFSARWAKENPDLRRISAGARRARVRMQAGRVSRNIVQSLMSLQRCRCAICGTDLKKSGNHLDHVMPLALGGLHDDANLQLLCPTCNLSKNAKHPVDFMQERGFLL